MIYASQRRLVSAVCVALASCAVGREDSGTFEVRFEHPDGAKTDGSLWVTARIVEGRARRVVVEAAAQPLLPDTTLGFSEVPYGTSYRVQVELRKSTDREQPLLYWGESSAFDFALGTDLALQVPMALGPGPHGTPGELGPITVLEAGTPDLIDGQNQDALYTNKTLVTLSLGVAIATRAVVAHDPALKVGRQERDVADLTPRGDRRVWTKWDLCKGLRTDGDACPTGLRGVYVQYVDALGHVSPVYSAVFNLDLDSPSVFEFDQPTLQTLPSGEQRANIRFYVDEPLGYEPTAISDPPLSLTVGRVTATSQETYEVTRMITREEVEATSYPVQVELIDRAGNRELRYVGRFLFDFTPPSIVAVHTRIEPARARTGQTVSVSCQVSEPLDQSQVPTMLIGGSIVRDCVQSLDIWHYVCTHVVGPDELRGVQAIAIDLLDQAGNRSSVAVGQVVYEDG
jgi:hypothetical protein